VFVFFSRMDDRGFQRNPTERDGKKECMCVSYREWRGALSEAREEDKKMHLRKKVKKRQK
jgi:hypothetical protein